MAQFFTIDSENKVTNVIVSETALEPDWIATPSGEEASIGAVWNSSTQTFSPPVASADDNEAKAKELLIDSDWTQLPDINLTYDSITAFRTYRATIRAVAKNPTSGEVNWPEEPTPEYN